MKRLRTYPKVTITKKEEKRIVLGHPWVFQDEITSIDKPYQNGDFVDVISEKGKYLGTGFINDHSKIRVRIVSRNSNDKIDESFWKRRIEYAWNYRKTVMRDDINCCRIIFGEADAFPGLTVDRFESVLVVQITSLGMELRKDIILPLLYDVLTSDNQKIRGIYLRNDIALRRLEGLEEEKTWYHYPEVKEKESTKELITENGITYLVDFENGQKTGFFLDQKYNRMSVRKIAKEKTVLDCCTHTGSFAMNAAMGGAKKVCAVDISESALTLAKENIKRNHLEHIIETKQADVFDLLKELEEKKSHAFDMIILDPPAFTKSRSTIKNATKGYKEINYRAMKILPRGGYLVTASCSHFMGEKHFEEMLQSAAKDANVSLREIEVRKQAPDHPILWNVKETSYLKFYLFQIV